MKVAIVHYWLVTMRGGEKVLEALLDLFPNADIFTHVYDRTAVSEKINKHRIITSKINRFPFAKKIYTFYMPLMPSALLDFNLQDYDLVISSESGPAKGVVPNPGAFHICYCHSPMRYLWDMYHEYFRKSNPFVRFFMKRLIPGLRLWDVASANLVDHFVTNSEYVAKRVRRYYNRESTVVFPPVNIENFLSTERTPGDFYLFFGQLAGYKRADLAIKACLDSGRKLVVAGAGAKKNELKKYEKYDHVTFRGKVSSEDLRKLYGSARALLFPGIEDFGIIPVEANAAGCPVIAYRDGGALETVKENATGLFFDEQTSDSLIGALERFEVLEKNGVFTNRKVFTEHVRQFSRDVFTEKMSKIIAEKEHI